MKMAFIGSGNVAWHLSQALEDVGFPVITIYSRTLKNAKSLAVKMYNADATDSLDFSKSEAALFFICVKDDAIAEVCRQLILPENSILVHTSGSQPLAILQVNQPVKCGVFYPLQTFSQNRKIDISQTPFCLEAEDEETEDELSEIARQLSHIVYLINSEERRILHVSAVFASNFVNHLWTLAKQILDQNNLEFDLLKPLIQETVEKAMQAEDPKQVQTGPAVRNDTKLLQAHLAFLQNQPDLQKIYQLLSENIIRLSQRS